MLIMYQNVSMQCVIFCTIHLTIASQENLFTLTNYSVSVAPEFFDRGGLQRVLSISCHLRTPVNLVIGGLDQVLTKEKGTVLEGSCASPKLL